MTVLARQVANFAVLVAVLGVTVWRGVVRVEDWPNTFTVTVIANGKFVDMIEKWEAVGWKPGHVNVDLDFLAVRGLEQNVALHLATTKHRELGNGNNIQRVRGDLGRHAGKDDGRKPRDKNG